MKKIFSFITVMPAVIAVCYGQANTKLSNLVAPTAVNVNLLPGGASGTKDLGSNTKLWRNGHFNGTVYAYGNTSDFGVIAYSNEVGVYGNGSSRGVWGLGGTYGVRGEGDTYGVYGISTGNYGVYGNGGTFGVYGVSSSNYGVYGNGGTFGVYAISTNGFGVYGKSTNSYGGRFYSSNSIALWAVTGRGDNDYAAVFDGNTLCYNSYLTSDKNLKKNINDVNNAMSIINQLKPRNYEFRDDGKYATLQLPKGMHYGLLAQEVAEVLPNLVKESSHPIDPAAIEKMIHPSADGSLAATDEAQNLTQQKEEIETINIKAVNYTEFIPIIIKALQELDKENTKLKNEVATLSQLLNQNIKTSGSLSLNNASLGQNFPNPFTKSTVIAISIPKESNAASIVVTQTGTGEIVRTVPVSATTSQLTLDGGSLPAGSYAYTLYVDSKKIDTKQMVIGR